MLTSFEGFKESLLAVMKIRSANFVNTNCDLNYLMRLVYTDIAQSITFKTIKEEHLVDDSKLFVLKENDFDSSDPVSELTMRYNIATSIVDDEEINIENFMVVLDDYEYRLDDSSFPERYLDRNIYFYRPVIYAMESLPSKIFEEILNCMIEGLMYQIEVSIPSDIDGKLSNMFYQRFFAEKKKLQEKYPKLDL